jgi:hypothetical protein
VVCVRYMDMDTIWIRILRGYGYSMDILYGYGYHMDMDTTWIWILYGYGYYMDTNVNTESLGN